MTRLQIALRELIAQSELQPGDRVTELAMVARLGGSRTPMRTALMRLQEEGLLEALPTGGFAVASFSQDDVLDTIELRGTLEGLAVRLAAERGLRAATLNRLEARLDELDAALATDDEPRLIAAYVGHNAAFHLELTATCNAPPIIRQIERVCALPFASPSALVALNADPLGARRVFTIAQHQHRSLLDAVAHGHGTRAEEIAREHARLSKANLQKAFAAQGAPAAFPAALLLHRPASARRTRDDQ